LCNSAIIIALLHYCMQYCTIACNIATIACCNNYCNTCNNYCKAIAKLFFLLQSYCNYYKTYCIVPKLSHHTIALFQDYRKTMTNPLQSLISIAQTPILSQNLLQTKPLASLACSLALLTRSIYLALSFLLLLIIT
jgi:hypothetical protein